MSRRTFETPDGGDDEGRERHTAHGDVSFVLEPHLEGELNVVSFIRIAVNGSYRYVADDAESALGMCTSCVVRAKGGALSA